MKRKKRGKLTPHQSSIVIDLSRVMALRNIAHPYSFLLKIGINNNSAQKILLGKAVQLNLLTLTKLCTHLNCTPNDLYAVRSLELSSTHALNNLPLYSSASILNLFEAVQQKSLDEVEKIFTN